MVKIVSWCALATSLLALFFAWQAYSQLDRRADDALSRRELKLVQGLEPKVRQLCEEFDIDCPSTSPKTLEELMRPLAMLVTGLTAVPEVVEK